MYVSIDIYEYITHFLDDKSIVNMLSVNKKFNTDVYYFRVMQRKYPLLLVCQKETETYKQLFVRMTYFIDKIYKKYGVPCIHHEDYRPAMVFRDYWYKSGFNMYEYFLRYAAGAGDLDIVNLLIKDCRHLEGGLCEAARYGHLNIVQLLLKLGAEDSAAAILCASCDNHMNIINCLLEKIEDIPLALAETGSLEVVKTCLEGKDYDVTDALAWAREDGDLPEIVEYLESLM